VAKVCQRFSKRLEEDSGLKEEGWRDYVGFDHRFGHLGRLMLRDSKLEFRLQPFINEILKD